MSGFSRCGAAIAVAPPDPHKRVNFVQGLVLGADDLTQESAFLAHRAEWLARDLIGFGTVAGLRVTSEVLAGGASGIVVGAGVALGAGGRPIAVPMPHAVALDEWLEAHRDDVLYHLAPGLDSPPGDVLRLHLVLAYRQCATDAEPGPGEPCRTDELPRLFTRVADDFALELRLVPPGQPQEDAARELGAWLRSLEIADTPDGCATLDELLASLRAAFVIASPPESPASPPEPLRLYRGDVARFVRTAWRVWVTELRSASPAETPPDDAVLLASLELPVIEGPAGRWRVDHVAGVRIDETRRPYVLSLRAAQELLLGMLVTGAAGVPMPLAPAAAVVERTSELAALDPRPDARTSALPVTVVAAGVIKGGPKASTYRRPVYRSLRVASAKAGELLVRFDGYAEPGDRDAFQYLVKVCAQAVPASSRGGAARRPLAVHVNLAAFEPGGIRLLVTNPRGEPIPTKVMATLDFAIEISECRP